MTARKRTAPYCNVVTFPNRPRAAQAAEAAVEALVLDNLKAANAALDLHDRRRAMASYHLFPIGHHPAFPACNDREAGA